MSHYTRDSGTKKPIPWLLAAMPAYTLGMLAPVPFLFAALKLQICTLWLITTAYVVACVGAWVLAANADGSAASTLAGFAFLALVVVGTTHAFMLRESLSHGRSTQFDRAAPEPLEAAVKPSGNEITCAHLQEALSSLKARVSARAAALPTGCADLIDETFAQMEQVIAFVASNGHADAELRSVHAMLTDYLPTSIDTYLRLPQDYALSQRNPDGRTAADELELQLHLLRDSATDAARSLYRGDALRLQQQSAFLQSKFGNSELDLS